MRADVGVDNQVRIYVEDSGPGISPKKRKELFAKYQESLDLLNQGTGIGLNLSKKLMQIMKGDLYLDDSYHSGIEGCPGACFVVDLKIGAMDLDVEAALTTVDAPIEWMGQSPPSNKTDEASAAFSSVGTSESTDGPNLDSIGTPQEGAVRLLPSIGHQQDQSNTAPTELPDDLTVLFVDDDAMLRKLFMRAVKKVAPPTWKIQDVSSGEMALQLCETTKFDLIFLDQYMASVDKQLLGTETAQAMRAKGLECTICGLSANDLRDAFINSGADDFILKPMPCKASDLQKVLLRILFPTNGSMRGSFVQAA